MRRVPPGLRDMAVSAFWFSLMSLGVKAAGRRLPIQEVVLVRGVVTLALSWAVLRRAGLAVETLRVRAHDTAGPMHTLYVASLGA